MQKYNRSIEEGAIEGRREKMHGWRRVIGTGCLFGLVK